MERDKLKLANMLKRKKAEKEMGGAEKLRAKKKKRLIQDAAKCSILTELLVVEGRRSARLQSARPVKKRDPAADPMPVCQAAPGRVVISGPLRTVVCVFGCVQGAQN